MDESEQVNGTDPQSDEETFEHDRQKVKEQLNKMSFEELQKLKEEMGTKLYSRTMLGNTETKTKVKSFKRANKNRPREMSSKKMAHMAIKVKTANKVTARDPRFESFCGTFDKKTFEDNYKFVNDLRKKESAQLKEELKNITDEGEKKKIKFALQRLENQIRNEEMKNSNSEQTNNEKKTVEGKKVLFKKKSVMKLETLVNKYEKLKQTDKIQKHIEKKAKKLSGKERKNLSRHNLI